MKMETRGIIAVDLAFLKNELSAAVRQEIHSIMDSLRANTEHVKSGVKELETGLSVWSDCALQ